MSRLFINAQQLDPSRGSDGTDVKVRGTRDGALYQVPWLQALCLEGRMFGVQFGDANKGIVAVGTFGDGAIDVQEFDLLQTVPATVAVIPVYYKVAFLAHGTGACSVALVWGNTGVISGGITAVPYNMRPASSNVSACTVKGLGAAGGTTLVIDGVIYHEATTALTGVAGTPAQLGYEWSATKDSFIPVIEGLASPERLIAGFAASAGGTGWINYVYAELPISAIS